jgi:3-methyladenine DNA glycosylase AlkD
MHVKTSDKMSTVEEVFARMRALGNPHNVQGMARFGISVTSDTAFGLTAAAMKGLAKEIGRSHELALALWDTGNRDARHVAHMIADPEEFTEATAEQWARGFNSWDIVDGVCLYLLIYTPFAWKKAREWAKRDEEFVRRAAFSLMACLAVHDKSAPDARFSGLLPLIERCSDDERNFVKKAVNWALRQIGKRNLQLNRAASAAAGRIRERGTRSARWIAADALRELKSDAVQRRLRCRESAQSLNRKMRGRTSDSGVHSQ